MNWSALNKIAKISTIIYTVAPVSFYLLIFLPILLLALPSIDIPRDQLQNLGTTIYHFAELLYGASDILWLLFFYAPFIIVPLNIILLIHGIKDKNSDNIAFYVFGTILPIIVIIFREQLIAALS